MALNPLAPITDYQSTLNRIFWFTTAAALGAVWLLRHYLPAVEEALSRVDFELQTGAGKLLPMPGGYLIPAVAVGLMSRIFRIHSQIGHWLGIRERFEIDVILKELAMRVGVDVDLIPEEQWVEQRYDLMRNGFYHFANTRAPQIDEHLILQALDLWSWFWIVLEAAFVFVVTGLVLVALQVHEPGLMTFGGALVVGVIGLPAIRFQCKLYAIAQVRAILADPAREAMVREVFASLGAKTVPRRRAA